MTCDTTEMSVACRHAVFRKRRGAIILDGARFQVEADTFALLQKTDNFKEIVRPRGTCRPQHPHEAFGRNLRALFKILKPECGVHIVAEHGLSGFQIAVEDALDGFTEECLAEIRIALRPRPDGFFEVVSKGH